MSRKLRGQRDARLERSCAGAPGDNRSASGARRGERRRGPLDGREQSVGGSRSARRRIAPPSARAGLAATPDAAHDRVCSLALSDGVEVLEAAFAGHGFDRHRHDTYAIGVTVSGVQAFDYRGAARASAPGQVVVLHPDETHDGRAGAPGGFAYRIVYVAPALIHEAARAIAGRACALPFVREPVSTNPALAAAVRSAFPIEPTVAASRLSEVVAAGAAVVRDGTLSRDDEVDGLRVDDLVCRLAAALVAADPSCRRGAPAIRLDGRAVARARQLLDEDTSRVVRSSELEAVSGLSRYELARQFRAVFGTSPYRYSLMRRLDRVRAELGRCPSLADAALAAGFADQAHLSRMFKAVVGVAPSRYRGLLIDRR